MAARKSHFARPSYRFLSGERDYPINSNSVFEFDEADLWNSNSNHVASPESKKPIPNSRVSKKSVKRVVENDDQAGATAASLPVNIPDWSNILRGNYRDNRRRESDDDEDGDGEDRRIPPHEFLARQFDFEGTRIASFSVREGVGRTLKGRDLSKVRNAIWEKTGFED
ncbi:hypothetical protein HHK36_018197 [Tetracentron sinense]|uniref:Senescence regulator n=1 Tax=Tetracentron sinense TaxID=13715 RepID=A0A835DA39_TETSI|nr:hypothetical protein HHK36_018197 [Tetracentron sinense]